MLAVDVLLDDRYPVVRQVPRQLELHAGVVDGDVRGQDHGVPVALLPEAVDDRRHQPQHAARALELYQRPPVAVEPVEHLGVDGVGRLHPLLVVDVTTFGRKLLVLGPVELRERAGDDIAILELRRIGERLEQPSSDDLEAFLGAGRPPGRFDPPDEVPQPVERLPSASAADLDVAGTGRGGEPDVSDAGRLITSRQLAASLADSVSACAKVNCVSKVPTGRSRWSCSCRA